MHGDDGPIPALNALIDELFSDRAPDSSSTLARISGLLTVQTKTIAQAQIARRLRTTGSLGPDLAVNAACVMSMSGVPAHRLLHFLSVSLPGAMSLSQFEIAVRFMFGNSPPLSQQLLYDLTQYTYLDRKLLAQRSVEAASRLTRTLSPRLLLFLYILSLRDDLSNENVHLILLILRLCFPALKLRGRSGDISRIEEQEITEAWKSAQRSARYVEILPSSIARSAREEIGSRDSASYFLDKYFGDPGAGVNEKGRDQKVDRARLSLALTTKRGGHNRGSPAAGQTRSWKGKTTGHNRHAAPSPAASSIGEALKPAAMQVLARSAPVPAQAAQGVRLRWGALWLLPFCVVTALAVALFSANSGLEKSLSTHSGVRAPGPMTQEAEQDSRHVVQHGDSVWKIYLSLRAGGRAGEWKDFLKLVKETNDLSDPDRIYPGDLLWITKGRR